MNSLRFIKNVLYTLKRDYGLPATIVWRTSSVPNLETGKLEVTQDSVAVNRAIVLPRVLQRDFVYDLSFIASNKNFTYGGLFDKNSRKVYLDPDDLPAGFDIKIGYWIIFNGIRYEVKAVDTYESNAAIDLDVSQVDNAILNNLIKKVYYDDLFLDQSVEVQVE
jgi:hypothetical protein